MHRSLHATFLMDGAAMFESIELIEPIVFRLGVMMKQNKGRGSLFFSSYGWYQVIQQ